MARPHKLTLDFFLHDATARNDRKIRAIRRKHGNDGYAAYFCLLEMLCHEDDLKLRLSNPLDMETAVEDCGLRDEAHLYKIIETAVDLGLFDPQLWHSERIVFSESLFSAWSTRLEERRKDIEKKKLRGGTSRWLTLRAEVFARDNYTCQYCGDRGSDLHCDHVIPVSRGGINELSNLATSCKRCNLSKSDKTPEEWLGGAS